MSTVTARACPNCNQTVDADSKFCQHCASTIPERGKTTSGDFTEAVKTKQVKSLKRRYVDGYRQARFIDGVGTFFKAIGIVLAVVVGLATLVAADSRGAPPAIVIIGGIVAVLVFAIFFIGGVIISASGQMLKASLDSAVNNSPMLTNDDRAVIMSLPQS